MIKVKAHGWCLAYLQSDYEPASARIARESRRKPLRAFGCSGAALVGLLFAASLQAADFADRYPQVRGYFPQADRFGEPEGEPPAAPAYRGNTLLGYAYLSTDAVRIPAYCWCCSRR